MLEAQIKIEDDLAAKGFKRALKNRALVDHAKFYGNYLLIVWVAVSVIDGLFGAGELIFIHFLAITVLWLAATAYGYSKWLNQISNLKGWEFHAKLDEQGVITNSENQERINWNFYKNRRIFRNCFYKFRNIRRFDKRLNPFLIYFKLILNGPV